MAVEGVTDDTSAGMSVTVKHFPTLYDNVSAVDATC